jgi:anthranilate synthase component I
MLRSLPPSPFGRERTAGMLMRRIGSRCDLAAMQRNDPERYPCLLQSVARGNARARYDLLLAAVPEGLRLDTDGVTRHLDGRIEQGGFLPALDRVWSAARDDTGSPDAAASLPFHGGWALYLGYELAAQIEPRLRLPDPPGTLPHALALRCPGALLHDLESDELIAIAEHGRDALLTTIEADAQRAAKAVSAAPVVLESLQEDDPAHYLAGARRTLDYIADGDVFQVNLSRGWCATVADDVTVGDVYDALRRANPAPFAASFLHDDWAVLSSSPERLISLRGRRVETRPIAGTRARIAGDDDAERVRELIGNPKERAEHIMLIDLERNDLGRVCRPGSVEVDELMSVESYAHVHHIVSNVRGVLRDGVTPGEAIAAVFPGGTITGCPKVRCMQIIAELEQVGRGPYTGAIGYLDVRGDLDLNILIRTLWMQHGALRFRAGAGIVADSRVELELAETRAKARGLLRALGVTS